MSLRRPVPGLLVAGKYRLQAIIGRGGSAHVFRAVDERRGVPVALKLLRPSAGPRDLVRRFFEEATVANRIEHAAIVRIDDAGFAETGPYLAMELLDGISLAGLLARAKRLPVPAAVDVCVRVLDALGAAHRAGVVHLDLKPDHVFLQRAVDGTRLRLLDFGLARFAGVFGTAPYLSPEQACAEPEIDGRSDLFSLATVLFELVTGELPFRAATDAATAYRIVHAPAPTLADTGLAAWPALEAVLARAFRKLPAERHATALDFARDLDRAVPGSGGALEEVLAPLAPDLVAVVPPSSGAMPVARAPALVSVPLPFALPRPEPTARPHVRGVVLRSLDAAVESRFGEASRVRVVERMPEPWRGELRRRALVRFALYDLDAFTAYADAALDTVLAHDPRAFRELGRAAVRGELAAAVEPALRAGRAISAVRRGVGVWSGLVDLGAWSTREEAGGPVWVRAERAATAPPSLRHWLVGAVEQALWSAGWRDARVQANDAAGGAELALRIDAGARTVA